MVLVKKFERRRAFDREILKLNLMGGCEEDSSGSEWGIVAGSRGKGKQASSQHKLDEIP